MSDVQVLVVNDKPDVRAFFGKVLSQEGVQVSLASDGAQSLALLGQQSVRVLFTDLCMPKMDGLSLLRQALRVRPQLSTVVFTGRARLESCIEAMRLGACDYVMKPFTAEAIRGALGRALQFSAGKAAAASQASATARCHAEEPDAALIAESPAMREVRALAARIAPSDVPVLVLGEPQVEKELLARTIHQQSRRAGGPFVRITCDALRETELADILFGTDPRRATDGGPIEKGLLNEARGGTVFLADVETLPLWAQVGLADVFQQNCVCRSASCQEAALDVRVIASASCDLETAMAKGQFHAGLYYALDAVTLRIPPLRERSADIKAWANRCLAQTLRRHGGAAGPGQYHFTSQAWECLLNHDWPGNVLELASVVSHAVALSETPEIGRDALAIASRKVHVKRTDAIAVPLEGNLRQIERRVIDEVIQRCRGNKAAAARVLGLHRRTLYRLLEEEPADGAAGTPIS